MKNKIKAVAKILSKYGTLTVLGIISTWLRLANLGYSDFQGDEIKALFIPEPNQSISDFLLTQRKGPIQFFITYLLKFLNPMYDNQLLMRMPFAVAGIFAIYFFYKFLKLHFSEKIAFYASFILSVNGFLVAFSRIVQYQSFVILFMILALYFLSLASKDKKYEVKGVYLGFIFWALSILSHYDGVFIAPFAAYLLFVWLRQDSNTLITTAENATGQNSQKRKIKHLVIAMAISGAMLAAFYIPFVLYITDKTMDYWQNRISGGEGKISSSKYLFTVYHPIYVVHIYTILASAGGVFVFFNIIKGFIIDKLRTLFARKSSFELLLDDKKTLIYLALGAWFLLPAMFLEVFVNIPGTHIYTYLIPLTVFLAFGINFFEIVLRFVFIKLGAQIVTVVGVTTLFAFLFLQTSAVFVDHNQEYPWESEKFLIWEFNKPTPIFHLSMFGFPYYRSWEEIGKFVQNSVNNGFYSTNERKSIARFYIPFEKDTDSAGHYVFIKNPQSFTDEILSEKAKYWADNHSPVYTFTKDGKEKAKVYYMPKGTLQDLIYLGY